MTRLTHSTEQILYALNQYVRKQQVAGIMSWDIATDVSYNNEQSLLKAVHEEIYQ